MVPLMQEYRKEYPSTPLYLRGDSGFASPDLYEACEENDCKYAIRLKQNSWNNSTLTTSNGPCEQAGAGAPIFVNKYPIFPYRLKGLS